MTTCTYSELTFITLQYTQLVDINARRRNADAIYRPQDFYGQLRTLIVLDLPASHKLHLTEPSTLVLAVIQKSQGGLHA